MQQHFLAHKANLKGKLTKLDNEILDMYFNDPDKTIYGVYVRFRAQRRKALPYFQYLLKGLDKNTKPNQVAYMCWEAATSPSNITQEAVVAAIRTVYGEVTNERTGRLEINAHNGTYKDVVRRIHRIAARNGKQAIIHPLALPAMYGQRLLPAYQELAKSADLTIRAGLKLISVGIPLTAAEHTAAATMVTRLMANTPETVKLTTSSLQTGVDSAAIAISSRIMGDLTKPE